MNSGSLTDASHRLCRMKTFGLEILSLTLWKKSFSWKQKQSTFPLSNYLVASDRLVMSDCPAASPHGVHERRLGVAHQDEDVGI